MARERCLQLEKIRRNARRCLAERFAGERKLAEMALAEVARCEPADSAAYTLLSFASLPDRLRYLRGSAPEREALVRETLACGGVRDARGCFWEILR